MNNQLIQKQLTRKALFNPGPLTTSSAIKASLVVEDICPREKEFGELVKSVRKKLLQVVNGEKDYEAVLLGSSGTGAIESVLTSLYDERMKAKSFLILENGAYGKRMQEILSAYKIPFQALKFDWGEAIDLAMVKDYLQKHRGEFSTLCFIHHETTVGILNPLEELQAIGKDFSLVTVVDAMSSFAGIEIDVMKTPVDFLISSSNKCVQALPGIGIVIARSQSLERIKNYPIRNYYLNLYANYCHQKEKNEFAFTPPVQIVYSLNAALNELAIEGGVKKRYQRYSDLYEQLIEGMQEMNFQFLVPQEHHSKLLTTFIPPINCPLFNFEKMHDELYAQDMTIYPGKILGGNNFRLSNIGDLNHQDITNLLQAIRSYLNRLQEER